MKKFFAGISCRVAVDVLLMSCTSCIDRYMMKPAFRRCSSVGHCPGDGLNDTATADDPSNRKIQIFEQFCPGRQAGHKYKYLWGAKR